jgi:aminoglycoside phosphotransferase
MTTPVPPLVTEPLSAALSPLGIDAGRLSSRPHQGKGRPVHHFVGQGVIVDIALDDQGRHLNRLEEHGRRWAAGAGVRTPRILSFDEPAGDWLVSEMIDVAPARGADYIGAALELAERIERTAPPIGAPVATSWRASRRTRPARLARACAAGLPVQLWLQVKRAVASLPRGIAAHGDFHSRNVLVARHGGVAVVDWEYLAPAPRHTDVLRFWSTLDHPADRGLVLDRVMSPLSRSERADFGLLALWLALRLFAENVSSPRRARHPGNTAHSRAMVAEARALARSVGAPAA